MPEANGDDARIISIIADKMRETEQYVEAVAARNPKILEYLQLINDLRLLSLASQPDHAQNSFVRLRAFRISIRRFGILGARHLLSLAAPVSDQRLIVTIRERDGRERADVASLERQANAADADLLRIYTERRMAGEKRAQSLAGAMKTLGRTSRGEAGAETAMTAATKAARERGYVDPNAPALVAFASASPEPQIKVADLAKRGRPKKIRQIDRRSAVLVRFVSGQSSPSRRVSCRSWRIRNMLVSVTEAAEMLSIGRSTLYRLIAQRKVSIVKIGRRTLVRTASIQALAGDGEQV